MANAVKFFFVCLFCFLSWKFWMTKYYVGILGEVLEKDLNRIFINFSDVSLICWFIKMSIYSQSHHLYCLVGTRVGGHWSLHLALMPAMALLQLVLLLSWVWSWNTDEAQMLFLVWPKLCLCSQQTWDFVPKVIGYRLEPHCLEGLMLKCMVVQERRKQVSQGVELG